MKQAGLHDDNLGHSDDSCYFNTGPLRRGWAMRVPELRAEATYVYGQKPQILFTQIKC